MKYTLALSCLILAIIINVSSTQAYHLASFLNVSYERVEATPVEKGGRKVKKRTLKLKKKKGLRKKQLKTKNSNKNRRFKFVLMLIGGCLLAILSVVLLILLTPTVGVVTTGVVMGVAKYFGWIAFAASACAALIFIWIGIAVLNSMPDADAPLTPTEQLVEDSAKKYPNIPLHKIEEYVALKEEIDQLEKEKSKESSKEKLRILEAELGVKKQKQVFLEELNDELETVADKNRVEYIFLKEEIYILNGKKELLERSKDQKNKEKVKKINAKIEGNLTKMKALEK